MKRYSVAVTGIPNAQPDHAILMVKFARACLAKTEELVHELVDSLGPDTAELNMRIGLVGLREMSSRLLWFVDDDPCTACLFD